MDAIDNAGMITLSEDNDAAGNNVITYCCFTANAGSCFRCSSSVLFIIFDVLVFFRIFSSKLVLFTSTLSLIYF